MSRPITAPAGEIAWLYEPVPGLGKCLLLNPGGCLMLGPPMGAYGVEYIAWCPMPRRDKALERRVLPAQPTGVS